MKARGAVYWAVVAGAGLAGAGLAHLSHRAVDEVRERNELETGYRFVPSPDAMKVASVGFDQQVGDLLWIRTVLAFGSNLGDQRPEWGEFLFRNLVALTALDPTWRTPYFYGGSLLRTVGAIEQSTELFKLGSEALPDDYYFPFSVGMNYYLHHEDLLEAARWLTIASERPGAPGWYARAAGAFVANKGERGMARRYLVEQLEQTEDEDLRADLERRIAQLDHDEFAERLNQYARAFEREYGQPFRDVEQLVGADLPQLEPLAGIPPDPLGARWVVDHDGEVLSEVALERRIAEEQRLERRTVRYLRPALRGGAR